MRTLHRLLVAGMLATVSQAQAQTVEDTLPERRHYVGSSAFVLANVVPNDNAPSFYQLNYGYWLTARDVVSVEAITWKYHWPLGLPYGPSFEAPDQRYPGHVREFGVGLAYQRFLWRDSYSAIHATPLVQTYVDDQGRKIQNGFRLFTTLRFGYHFRLFSDRFFVEPSVAFTHWPISSNVPEAFRERERRWPNYFLFEPGLHIGMKR